jgi:hypothetical protein
MRATSSQVLPLPAQASTTTECCGSQAALVKPWASTTAPFKR